MSSNASLPVPDQIVQSNISSTVPPSPSSFKQLEVEYSEMRKGNNGRRLVSEGHLLKLPKYDPLRIPIESHKVQVSI